MLFVFSALNPALATQQITGKVTEVIKSAGFTYVQVVNQQSKIWAAGPGDSPLKKGEVIAFSAKMPMQNFHSKSLGRDFPIIYFVKSFETGNVILTPTSPHGVPNQKSLIRPFAADFSNITGEIKRGGYLADKTMDGLNTSEKKISEFRGKPLIINVWASWCGPCRAEMGSLERLAKKYNRKEFTIIGISTDDYRTKAEAAVKQANLSFENFIDHDQVLEKMLGAKTIPLTILVDANGQVIEKVRGAREWDSAEITDSISRAFNIKLK